MKIQVVRCDGRIETLQLVGTVQAGEPSPNGQGSLAVEATGMTHFFRAEDGAYDGWGMDVSEANLPQGDVIAFIEAVDRDREIKDFEES